MSMTISNSREMKPIRRFLIIFLLPIHVNPFTHSQFKAVRLISSKKRPCRVTKFRISIASQDSPDISSIITTSADSNAVTNLMTISSTLIETPKDVCLDATVQEKELLDDIPSQQEEEEEEVLDAPNLKTIIRFAVPAIGVWLCNPLLSLIDTSCVGLLSGTIQQAALNPATAVTDYGALLAVSNCL